MELTAPSQVVFYDDTGHAWQTWRLIPVKSSEGAFMPLQLPLVRVPLFHTNIKDATGEPSTRTQHLESESDDFGTMVTEVTTVTTRKRYRVQEV